MFRRKFLLAGVSLLALGAISPAQSGETLSGQKAYELMKRTFSSGSNFLVYEVFPQGNNRYTVDFQIERLPVPRTCDVPAACRGMTDYLTGHGSALLAQDTAGHWAIVAMHIGRTHWDNIRIYLP